MKNVPEREEVKESESLLCFGAHTWLKFNIYGYSNGLNPYPWTLAVKGSKDPQKGLYPERGQKRVKNGQKWPPEGSKVTKTTLKGRFEGVYLTIPPYPGDPKWSKMRFFHGVILRRTLKMHILRYAPLPPNPPTPPKAPKIGLFRGVHEGIWSK